MAGLGGVDATDGGSLGLGGGDQVLGGSYSVPVGVLVDVTVGLSNLEKKNYYSERVTIIQG